VNPEAAALAEFSKQAEAYVALQKKLAAASGAKLTETANQAEIAVREKKLGENIRRARAAAKPGEVFNPGAAKVFKRLISTDFNQRTGQKKRLADETPGPRPPGDQSDLSEHGPACHISGHAARGAP
jgi:hypothetical protein